jgi:serine/threonine protein kinase
MGNMHQSEVRTWKETSKVFAKLCQAFSRWPSSLHVNGITLSSRDSVGTGGFSDVFHGKLPGSGLEVALKRPRLFADSSPRHTKVSHWTCVTVPMGRSHSFVQRIYQEVIIWQHVKHPHVLPFLGIDICTFPPMICMVSPWMAHKSLDKYIKDNMSPVDDVNSLVCRKTTPHAVAQAISSSSMQWKACGTYIAVQSYTVTSSV